MGTRFERVRSARNLTGPAGLAGLAALLGPLAVAGVFTCACEAPRARPALLPPAGTQVVRVDQADDDDDDDEPAQWLAEASPEPRPGVEYVKMSEWTSPPSVQALEAVIPPRGDVPPTYIQFPKLTKHSGIGGTSSRRH